MKSTEKNLKNSLTTKSRSDIINIEREVNKMEKLLRKLWLSAEFESDFERDWLAVYEKIKAGVTISTPILDCCLLYLKEWEEKQRT